MHAPQPSTQPTEREVPDGGRGRPQCWPRRLRRREIHLPVSYERPSITQDAIGKAIDAGFQHIVLGLPAPYPANVAPWVTDELITTAA
jgi:hypothetical protein